MCHQTLAFDDDVGKLEKAGIITGVVWIAWAVILLGGECPE